MSRLRSLLLQELHPLSLTALPWFTLGTAAVLGHFVQQW